MSDQEFVVDGESGQRLPNNPGRVKLFQVQPDGTVKIQTVTITPTVSINFKQLMGQGWIVENHLRTIERVTGYTFKPFGAAAAPAEYLAGKMAELGIMPSGTAPKKRGRPAKVKTEGGGLVG